MAAQYEAVPDNRSWYQKAMYRVLMWAHTHTESLWHWCYYKSRQYAKPEMRRIADKHIEFIDTSST